MGSPDTLADGDCQVIRLNTAIRKQLRGLVAT
ncbi:unnamed protein product, partial [marine sediment metagenome]